MSDHPRLVASIFNDEQPRRDRSRQGLRWHDEARFIKTWLEHPRSTGALSPSGRKLSRTIARQVDPAIPGPVIELGPGTGPVTDALIRRGIVPERLILVEYETAFCKLLARRYPQCKVVQGDAYALSHTLRAVLDRPAAAVVSGLPLLNRPEHQRLSLLADAFTLLQPGAPFVQFTYGMLSPIPRHGAGRSPGFEAKASAPVWLNLPPARVWTYRSTQANGTMLDGLVPELSDHMPFGLASCGDDWRDKLKTEWLARSAEAKAEWRARTSKVRDGLAKHGLRIKAARDERAGRGWDQRIR